MYSTEILSNTATIREVNSTVIDSFLDVDTRSVERTIVMGQNMQMCHSLRCKLLVDNMESLGTSFSKTSKVESSPFGFCVSLL